MNTALLMILLILAVFVSIFGDIRFKAGKQLGYAQSEADWQQTLHDIRLGHWTPTSGCL